MSQGKKIQVQNKVNVINKFSISELAALYLLRETEKYDQILEQIHMDFEMVKK